MYDIIVIGGGPAGLTAALYARRANKSVLVIEKDAFGGQITHSPKVENIPGFYSLSGNEFAEKRKDFDCNLRELDKADDNDNGNENCRGEVKKYGQRRNSHNKTRHETAERNCADTAKKSEKNVVVIFLF